MKKIVTSIIIIITITSCFKNTIANNEAFKEDIVVPKKELSDDILNKLKATTTVFFLKDDDSKKNDSLISAISSIWHITPVIFDKIDNYDKYTSNPKYSYFSIEQITTRSESSISNHSYLTLRLYDNTIKNEKENRIGLCRIELFPNTASINLLVSGKSKIDAAKKLHKEGVFYNWSPILLKAQLASVQSNLNAKIRPWLFENIEDANLSELLSNDTLYVPQNVLVSYNPLTAKEKNEKENVFSDYKHKYRICSENELYNIFEVEKRGRFLFEYVKSSADKFITIYDLKNQKIVYKKYTPISYNLKSKDISQIK